MADPHPPILRPMPAVDSGLVEIVREFLLAHRLLRRVSERYRAGELKFELAARLRDEVQDLKKELRAMERAGHA